MSHAYPLSGDPVQVLGSRGEPLTGTTSAAKARGLVQGGRAVFVGPDTIRVLWNRGEFSRYILRRDDYTCQYCGGPGQTVDHVTPRSRGGYSTPANCLCACETCNLQKADRTLAEYDWYIRSLPCQCHRRGGTPSPCCKHRVLDRLEGLLATGSNLPEPVGRAVHAGTMRRARARRHRSGSKSSHGR